LYEFCNICLIDPIEYLAIWHLCESWGKILIEFTEGNDPFVFVIIPELFYNGFEYSTRSLTPTYDENMWLLCFPLNDSSREIYRLIKYWVEYLSYDTCWCFWKISLCTTKSEKYFFGYFSENLIRSASYSIRFMDIEWDME
jgi:hypothetical protein